MPLPPRVAGRNSACGLALFSFLACSGTNPSSKTAADNPRSERITSQNERPTEIPLAIAPALPFSHCAPRTSLAELCAAWRGHRGARYSAGHCTIPDCGVRLLAEDGKRRALELRVDYEPIDGLSSVSGENYYPSPPDSLGCFVAAGSLRVYFDGTQYFPLDETQFQNDSSGKLLSETTAQFMDEVLQFSTVERYEDAYADETEETDRTRRFEVKREPIEELSSCSKESPCRVACYDAEAPPPTRHARSEVQCDTLSSVCGEPAPLNAREFVCKDRENFEQIACLHDLRKLEIKADIRDPWLLEIVSQLPHLEELTIGDLVGVHLSPLASLTTLRQLSLRTSRPSELRSLSSLENLEELTVVDYSGDDYEALGSLTKLEKLGLSRTRVHDLGFVSSLKGLRHLDLSYTLVSDLGPVSTLTSLEELSLAATWVSDLSPLQSLQQLRQLDLSGSAVSDLSPISRLQGLENVDTMGSKITDRTPKDEPPALGKD